MNCLLVDTAFAIRIELILLVVSLTMIGKSGNDHKYVLPQQEYNGIIFFLTEQISFRMTYKKNNIFN